MGGLDGFAGAGGWGSGSGGQEREGVFDAGVHDEVAFVGGLEPFGDCVEEPGAELGGDEEGDSAVGCCADVSASCLDGLDSCSVLPDGPASVFAEAAVFELGLGSIFGREAGAEEEGDGGDCARGVEAFCEVRGGA